ncbi:transcriptional regulator [Xanthobacteraceae bacterium A53D]
MAVMKHTDPALQRAITSVGSSALLAELVGITPQALSQWRRVPALRVLAVEAATRGLVMRHELRPDLYPPPSSKRKGLRAQELRP